MCRHLAYLGPPVPLATLVLDPPYGLHRQSFAPRMQAAGRINADGFGVGWYAEEHPRPARYRRAQPIWTDASFASVAEVVASGCVLAAVRAATPGFPIEESATAPFTAQRWLFSHNGALADWEDVEPPMALEARVDSAALWALTLHRLRGGSPLGEALTATLVDVLEVTTGRLNLLLTDGESIAATAYGDTLFVRQQAGIVLASEPFDDASGWREVPPGSLVTAGPDGVAVTPLPLPPPTAATTAAPGGPLRVTAATNAAAPSQ